jgi:hypothetical protein
MASSSHQADVVRAFLHEVFPPVLFNADAEACDIIEHLKSRTFAAAAQRARLAASILRQAAVAGDDPVLEEGLHALHMGLHERGMSMQHANAPVPPRHPPLLQTHPAQLALLRKLFMCTVLLLDASCSSAPAHVVPRHAASLLRGLASIAQGAVEMPQLASLELALLTHAAEADELQPTLLDLCLASSQLPLPSSSLGPEGEEVCEPPAVLARRTLALRWASCALATPPLAPRLWDALPLVVQTSTRLRTAEPDAYRSAVVSVVCSALGGLVVDAPAQRVLAEVVLETVRSRCEELVGLLMAAEEAAEGASCQPGGSHGGRVPAIHQAPSRAGAARALYATQLETLCGLLFGLLPSIKQPLLSQLLEGARGLVLGSVPREHVCALCCSHLRGAISTAGPGPRKHALVQWMLELNAEVTNEVQAVKGGARPPPQSMAHPPTAGDTAAPS